MYVTLVRPLLEYCAVVWAPHQLYLIARLESIQTRFLRMVGVKIGFSYLGTPLLEVAQILDLQTLACRRSLIDVCFLQRLVCGSIDCLELLERIDFNLPSRTRSAQLFGRRGVASNYIYQSAIPRLHRIGNKVCECVDFFSYSPILFKKKVLPHLL